MFLVGTILFVFGVGLINFVMMGAWRLVASHEENTRRGLEGWSVDFIAWWFVTATTKWKPLIGIGVVSILLGVAAWTLN